MKRNIDKQNKAKVEGNKKSSGRTSKKLVVVYTTIGAFLIVLGVYGIPVKSLKGEDSITAVQLPISTDIYDEIDDAQGNKAVKRIERILSAIEEGRVTEREAEILSFMEDLIPFESNRELFTSLNNAFGVNEEEFRSIGKTMESIGLSMSLYV